jgi:hypothetical protein
MGRSPSAGGAAGGGGVAGIETAVKERRGRGNSKNKSKQSKRNQPEGKQPKLLQEEVNTVVAVVVDNGATSKRKGW